jgi:colanic acid/amylovoran biosynthesis glycosyltransferase
MTQTPSTAVAYIASRYPKGSETFVFREVCELERQGHRVLVVAFGSGDGALVHPDAASAARLVVLPKPAAVVAAQLYWLRRRPARYLRAWLDCIAGAGTSPGMLARTIPAVPVGAFVARLVAERGIRHIHAHRATHPAAAALVAGTLTGTPFSFTAHGYDVELDTTMLRTKLRRASFAVAISDYTRSLLDTLLPGARIVVVRCGVDGDAFAPTPRPAGEGPFRVACIGRLSPEKGQEHLLRALALLEAGGRRLTCTFVGDGDDRERLERLRVSLGLNDVRFTGQLESAGVRSVLADAHAMVLPSLREGIPVTLMEAMSMRVPVIASSVGGVPELVRDGVTGLLVAPGDEQQIADALERLAGDPALGARLADAGAVVVADRHGATASAASRARLYATAGVA